MRYLLDTHIFLWFISKDNRISDPIRTTICEADEVYLSVVSVWEATIKQQLGKLPLPQPAPLYLPTQRQKHEIASLEICENTLTFLPDLANHHRDPFDRLLICQALEQDLTFITVDEEIIKYPLKLLVP